MAEHAGISNTIRETTVFADFQKPLLARTTRWDYVRRYIPLWKEAIRFRLYMVVLAIIAVVFIAIQPIVSVFAAAGAAYFYSLLQMRIGRLSSPRKVIWSH